MANISRWYTEDLIVELTEKETQTALNKSTRDNIDLASLADWFSNPNDEYYQLNLSFPINYSDDSISFLRDGKFNDIEKFSDLDFIGELQEKGAETYVKNGLPKDLREYIIFTLESATTLSENQEKLIEIYNTLVDDCLITGRFFIDTGKKETGSLIYFQVILRLREESVDFFADVSSTIPTSSDLQSSITVGPFNFLDHAGYYYNNISSNGNVSFDHFRSADKALRYCKDLNFKNRGAGNASYIVDFNRLSAQIYDLYSRVATLFGKDGVKDLTDKKISLKDVDIVYYLQYIEDPEGNVTNINFVSYDMYINSNAPNKYSGAEEILTVITADTSLEFADRAFSDNVLHILANLPKIHAYFKKTKKSDFDLDFFVKEFIFRYKKRPEVKESTKVFNNGKSNYKTKDDVDLERTGMTPAQKNEIFNQTRKKVVQVGDQAFLNVLAKGKQLTTEKQIFDIVLNVIPLSELILTAATCLSKFIQGSPVKKVCRTVIRNLNLEQVDELLSYINTSTTNETNKLRQLILDSAIDTNDRQSFKNFLLDLADSQISDDDFLCIVIFAAIPAAIGMLSTFGKEEVQGFINQVERTIEGEVDKLSRQVVDEINDNIDKGANFLKEELINPAAEVFTAIEESLANHPFLSFTGDWKTQIQQLILQLVRDLIVNLTGLLIQEIAYMCEGSSKSDFANMNSLIPNDANFPNLSGPVVPFELDNIGMQELIPDESAYSDLKEFLDDFGDGDEISSDLIESFIESMAEILTISEMCTLVADDASDVNYSFILNKVWSGLLSLEKFAIIKQRLKTIGNLDLFFSILADKIDKSFCARKLQDLENTKKILSEICDPVSNSALIDDLKKKASDSAIQNLLNQEDEIVNDLLDAIYNLNNPQKPVAFCGPEADRKGVEPLFSSLQHPSMTYLDQQYLKSILSGTVSIFESNLASFKSIMLNLEGISNPSDVMNKIDNASNNVVGAMASAYGFDNENSGEISLPEGYSKLSKNDLSNKVENNAVVARQVNQQLLSFSDIGLVNSNDQNKTVSLGIDFSNNSIIDERILLNFNFDNSPHNVFGNVDTPENSVDFLIQNPTVNQDRRYTNSLGSNDYLNFKDIVNTFDNTNSIDNIIKSNFLENIGFYSNLTSQIIKEHAEYITKQDLFKAENFKDLKLNRNNLCEQSILIIQDILSELSSNIGDVECKFGLGSIPSARELGQIYALLTAYIRVITISEMLKSFFVFSSFSIDALLPSGSENDSSSFYFQYLVDQISERIISDNQNDFINTDSMTDYLITVYAGKNNLEKNQVDILDVFKEIIGSSIVLMQNKFKQKLQKAGYNSNIGEFTDEYSNQNTPYYQVYSNLKSTGFGGGDFSPVSANYSVNHEDAYYTISSNYGSIYGDIPRLINGGFFTETGVDIRRIYKGDPELLYTEELHQLIMDELNTKSETMSQAAYNASKDSSASIGNIPSNWERPPAKIILSLGGPLAVINIGQVYNLNVKNGALKNLFGSRMYGGTLKSAFQIDNTFAAATPEELRTLSLFEGLMGNPPFDVNEMLNSIGELRKFLDDYLDHDGEAYQAYITLTGKFYLNTFFKRFNYYAAHNLLLKVDGNPLLENLYDTVKLTMSPAHFPALSILSKKAFVESAVFNKKYFQKDSDTLYFKLPLLYFRRGFNASLSSQPVSAEPYAMESNYLPGQPLDALGQAFTASNFNLTPQGLKNIIASSSEYKSLIDNIQYKNVLSFVSILVTELIQKNYPLVNSMFDSTLANIRSNLAQLLNIANRGNDPDFYKNNPFQELPSVEYDMDLVSLVLQALLQAIANISDPTWVTPWFLPGPLSPIGIIAKILDGAGDSNPGDNRDKAKGAIDNDLLCEDD